MKFSVIWNMYASIGYYWRSAKHEKTFERCYEKNQKAFITKFYRILFGTHKWDLFVQYLMGRFLKESFKASLFALIYFYGVKYRLGKRCNL